MLRWILVVSVISILIGKWLCNRSVRNFQYKTRTGQQALNRYILDLNFCESEGDTNLMIESQASYWKQRRAGLFLQYAGAFLLLITLISIALYVVENLKY
ncbi:MAG: hypothetical protein WC528_02655 [Patescibacteria group bacterium]